MFRGPLVVAVEQAELRAVDVVVGDAGHELALAHARQARLLVEAVVAQTAGRVGEAEQVALLLQEQA